MATVAPRSANMTASSLPTRLPPPISTTLPRSSLAVAAGLSISQSLPRGVWYTGAAIHDPRQNEQEITEPVQIDPQVPGHLRTALAAELDNPPLRAATDSARQMDLRGRQGTARQDELAQR